MLWPARKSLSMTKNSAVPSACAACLQAPPCTWGVARKLLPELNPAVLPTSRGSIGTNSSGAITVDRPSHLFTRPVFGVSGQTDLTHEFWQLNSRCFNLLRKIASSPTSFLMLMTPFVFADWPHMFRLRRLAISTERPLTSWPPRNAR